MNNPIQGDMFPSFKRHRSPQSSARNVHNQLYYPMSITAMKHRQRERRLLVKAETITQSVTYFYV